MTETVPPAETWAIVELMGHLKLVGRISEEEKFGAKMGRIDIPRTEACKCANDEKSLLPKVPCDVCGGTGKVHGFMTQHFTGSSVYRISYVSEAIARHLASLTTAAPIRPWELPERALPAPSHERDGDEDGD